MNRLGTTGSGCKICNRPFAPLQGLRLGVRALAMAALGLACFVSLPRAATAAEPSAIAGSDESGRVLRVVIYTRRGCPRCTQAKAFLEQLRGERPALELVERRIDQDPSARRELERELEARGIAGGGVPAILLREQMLVGFESPETSGRRVRELLDVSATGSNLQSAGSCALDPNAPETGCDSPAQSPAQPVQQPVEVESTLFGRLSLSRLGLPLFTIALGLLDGFNPCAMWVLLFLLAMLAGQRDRTRMAVTAGTFVLASGVVYYAFMAAWLNVFLLIGVSRAVQAVLGLVALAIGALNVKDFVAFRRGPSLSIPEASKPSIYARVRRVLRADSLAASVLGVAVLAVLVNLVELLCTAGFPAVYTSVLARLELSGWARAGYLALYNLAYVADDTLVVTLAVLTLSRKRLTERAGRWLKLVSGLVMLGLGVVLVLAPDWLG